jgi:DNA-binding SARP family transcriptional activator
VESEGLERRVPAAKQRALLAALAISANDVVSIETLSRAMWDAGLPPSRRETTHTYVHRLRGSLGEEAGQRIVTQSPGYLLRVGHDELDLLEFESLARRGVGCVAAGDWHAVSSVLSEAEGLWRGTPLADIPSGEARDRYADYLKQKRLTVTELRIEAEIRNSRRGTAATLPELLDLTVRHPERERLWLLLMLACYRSGRQAEALKAFGLARQAITAGYGVDPGPELHDMHKRVYAHDRALLSEPLDRLCFA